MKKYSKKIIAEEEPEEVQYKNVYHIIMVFDYTNIIFPSQQFNVKGTKFGKNVVIAHPLVIQEVKLQFARTSVLMDVIVPKGCHYRMVFVFRKENALVYKVANIINTEKLTNQTIVKYGNYFFIFQD